ncbi:MAG: hypothetical protein K1X29_02270 [Bdellovibrionales bacterium]|nr:hypothetical protein [Bdellovibrionales bacterium]
MNETTKNPVTINYFYQKLSERVSTYNARLMLRAAMVSSGVQGEPDTVLEDEQAKAMCLALINKGGPAFQVGKNLYHDLQLQ